MKQLAILTIISLCYFTGYSQEKKGFWSLSFNLSHYSGLEMGGIRQDHFKYKISPGLEILYSHDINQNTQVKSGFSLQHIIMQPLGGLNRKGEIGEFSIPLLLTTPLISGTKSSLLFSAGIYQGKFLYSKWSQEVHHMWQSLNPEYIDDYSDKNFFMDGYIGLVYFDKKRNAHITPFIHYKFIENWMKHYRKSTYYGIKFGVNLKPFLKNN